MARPFQLLGPSHIGALLATAAAAAALVVLARARPAARSTRLVELALAALLVAAAGLFIALELAAGTATVWTFLPFHLCDLAIFVAAYALVTHRPLACETLYFWAFAGTLLAVVTPDLSVGPPDRAYFFYFGLHGAVIAAAAHLTLGRRITPRPLAPLRIWLLTAAYAAVILLVNLTAGTNYLYLVEKPAEPTPLDWFGPWPIYLLVCLALALVLFTLLHLPFRRRSA